MSTEPNEPTSESAFFTTIRSWGLVRSPQRVFGGVLSGTGARIGMAPVPARLIFVLIAILTGGFALLAYAAAWALLPDSEGRIIIQDFGRGTPNIGSLIAIGIMAFIGFFTLNNSGLASWGHWWNIDAFPDGGMFNAVPRLFALVALLIPLAIIGGVIFAIVWSVRQGKSTDRGAQGYARMPDGSVPDAPTAGGAVAGEGVAGDAIVGDATVGDATVGDATVADAHAQAAPEPATTFAAAAPIGAIAATSVITEPAPAYVPPVYTAPKATYTPKPRVPGPGKFGYLAALALIPIAAAITLYLHSSDQLAVFPAIAGGVIWVAGLGLILIINALRGRKAGFLGFVSVVALFPIGFAIASAPELRDTWENGGAWGWSWVDDGSYNGWSWGNPGAVESAEAAPTFTPVPALDPGDAFLDYESVAINGSCYKDPDVIKPDVTGTVRLSSVTADQTITVTSTDTLLSVPYGTSLNIINMGGTDGMASVFVSWGDRGLSCDLMGVGSPAVQLTNADAPVLTVQLDDTMTMGYMTLWIEEN